MLALEFENQRLYYDAKDLYFVLFEKTNNYEYLVKHLAIATQLKDYEIVEKNASKYYKNNIKQEEIILRLYTFALFKLGNNNDNATLKAEKLVKEFPNDVNLELLGTIYLQQQEMRETKKETQRQNFENTFFKMIDLYKSVVKDLSLEIPRIYNGIFSDDGIEEFSYTQYKIGEVLLFRGEKDLQGKEVIDELLKIFNMYKHALKTHPKKYQISEGEYEDFYKEYENVIRHYFSKIYKIFSFWSLKVEVFNNNNSTFLSLI